jgi:DNA-binding winged helix-turn-helix (wHTH) protein/tetratricopeptide (TPR) repeat protein
LSGLIPKCRELLQVPLRSPFFLSQYPLEKKEESALTSAFKGRLGITSKMDKNHRLQPVAVFGPYRFDLTSSELQKNGVWVRLEDKPARLLAALLEHPGEPVSREELRSRLWPNGVHVDFDHGLNKCVNKLRAALSDDSEKPRYVETLSRRGYRFVASIDFQSNGHCPSQPVESLGDAPPKESDFGPVVAQTPIDDRGGNWRRLAALVVLSAVVLGGTAVFFAWPSLQRKLHFAAKQNLSFNKRDWVLISNFENKTGNPVFDGTLEYALERELSNSQFVNVVPRERTTDALRLMRKPLNSKIDAALGREICLRDGGIRALLTGRVERLGTTYLLSVQLVDPANSVAVAGLSEEDPADSQMAAAIRRLSNRMREVLGEKTALIQQSEKRLEKVSTPSLHALQLYTQADELIRMTDDKQGVAAKLLESAIAEDPNFASAHLLLGWTLANRAMDAQARIEFQRAFNLADTTTDRERFFILGTYYQTVKEEATHATEAYEALLRLYPDHYWGANNLSGLYMRAGQWDDAWRLKARLADLRPDGLQENAAVACGKSVQDEVNGAQLYLRRATALASVDGDAFATTFLGLLPAFQSWAAGDVTQTRAQLKVFDDKAKDGAPSFFYLALGEFAEAERDIQRIPDDDVRQIRLAIAAFAKGDLRAAKRNLEQMRGSPGGTGLVVAGRCGLERIVERGIGETGKDAPVIKIVRGEQALARGQTKEGIALLEKGIEAARLMPTGPSFLGSESLARAYQKQGNLDAALRVLLQAADSKRRAYNCVNGGPMLGAFWLRTELQLADLYREMGRVPEAENVDNELRKMLIYADADHPIVLALKKRETLSANASSQSSGK